MIANMHTDDDVKLFDGSDILTAPRASAALITLGADVEEHQSVPALMDKLERALQNASTSEEMKKVRDLATAMQQYARNIGAGLEEQNRVAETKIRAERGLGEALAQLEKAKGGQPYQLRSTGDMMSPVDDDDPPTLKELGITKKQSSRWQAMWSVPQGDFEQYIAEVKGRGDELTSAGVIRFAKRLQKEPPRAGNSTVARSNENEDPATDIDEAQRDAEVVSPANPTPVTDGGAVPKRRHASAAEARASEKRIEHVLRQWAALSAEERVVVADAMADRWGALPVEEPAPGKNDDGPAQNADCIDLTASTGSRAAGTALDIGNDAALDGLASMRGQDATIEPVEMPSMREEFDGSAHKSALEKGDSDGEQDIDHHNPGFTDDSIGLKYYPTADTDPYNLHGLVWIYGAVEIEMQLLLIVAKQKQFPEPFIDETLARVSRLFEMLEGQRLPGTIDGLLRRYGYSEVVDQFYAVARAHTAT